MADWFLRLPEWICRVFQPGDENQLWRELCRTTDKRLRQQLKTARFQRVPAPAALRWREWHRVNIAGTDAYMNGNDADAQNRFERLVEITGKTGNSTWTRIIAGTSDPAQWWQAQIIRSGVGPWNQWRRAHPDIKPDLRGQLVSHEIAAPFAPEGQGAKISDFASANFADCDLTSATLYFAHLENSDFRGANLQGANLYECHLAGADFRSANLTGAVITETDLSGANLMGATGLTEEQLASAYWDSTTIHPDGLTRTRN